ncbi:hypothetical protein E4099_31545, partial [Streptomyces palmae]
PGPPSPSRRKLLTIGAGSAAAITAAGAGGRLWWNGREEPQSKPVSRRSPARRPPNVPSRAVWWRQVPPTDSQFPPLAVADLILVQHDRSLRALDARTGEKRWTSSYTRDGGYAPWTLALEKDRLYAFRDEVNPRNALSLHSVDLKTGSLRSLPVSLPDFDGGRRAHETRLLLVAGGTAYVYAQKRAEEKSDEGWHIVAIDLRTGRERWRKPVGYDGQDGITAKARGRHLVTARPMEDTLEAWDTRTGKVIWDWSLPGTGLFLYRNQLALDSTCLYYSTSELRSIPFRDPNGGWRFGKGRDKGLATGSRLYGRPALKDGVVYAAEGTRGLVAVDARDGTLLWECDIDQKPNLDTTPLVGKKYVYLADDRSSQISAIDLRDHKVAWTTPVPSRFDTTPVAHERARRFIWISGEIVCALPFE